MCIADAIATGVRINVTKHDRRMIIPRRFAA